MREHDEVDPKKPRPVRTSKKGSNRFERAEAAPWHSTRHDHDADHHRHVV